MQDTTREILVSGGVNVDELLERCMNNEALVGRLLKKFSDDATYGRLVEAFAAHDINKALEAAHTLKGLCGNLSLVRLADLFARQVTLLRADDPEAAMGLMPEISRGYDAAVQAIRKSFP